MKQANILLLVVTIVLIPLSLTFKIATYNNQIKINRIPIVPIIVGVEIIF